MSGARRPIDDAFPLILAGPSGAGKTTIRDRILALPGKPRTVFSVSTTTRAPRPGERDGVDYRFVDREAFAALVEAGAMLEHAEVHGERYGTPRENLERARAQGAHLLLDIDVQGARQVRLAVPEAVSVFVLPPSGDRILERLRRRGSETAEQLGRRLASARAELAAVTEFDYVVVNDDLEMAVAAIRAVIEAESRSIRRLGPEAERFARRLAGEIADAM